MNDTRRSGLTRREALGALIATQSGWLTGCGAEADPQHSAEDPAVGTVAEALTKQQLCDAFYAMNNLVTIKITMTAAAWSALKAEQPAGGTCNFDHVGDRFTWREADVEISGSVTPAAKLLKRVGIKKRSFCGSFDTTKPSFKLDFGKNLSGNVSTIEGLIGTQHLAFSNSIQDPYFMRQPLGYSLFKKAGLPNSRCNFTKVFVNGELIGVYVNVEPIKERYIERNFNNNLSGNLYEFEKDDFLTSRLPYMEAEKPSAFTNMKDIELASILLAANGTGLLPSIIDGNQFCLFYAMEFLLKHWDGYTHNQNNTFVYNDVVAIENGTHLKFKFIPWGLDQILQPHQTFRVSDKSVVSSIVRGDAGGMLTFLAAVGLLQQNVFSRTSLTETFSYIDTMKYVLASAGVTVPPEEIAALKKELKLARSATFVTLGVPPDIGFNIIGKDSDHVMRASNVEKVGSSTTDYEVMHIVPVNDAAERWKFTRVDTASYELVNEAYGRWLHAGTGPLTPANHKYVYNTSKADSSGAHVFYFARSSLDVGPYELSGYFHLWSSVTNFRLMFGNDDPTPAGKQRVYQYGVGAAAATYLYLW